MVLWWTSRPIYLMLFIGCSFRQAWLTASHSSHSLLRKGRPFIMRAPSEPILLGWGFSNDSHRHRVRLSQATDRTSLPLSLLSASASCEFWRSGAKTDRAR